MVALKKCNTRGRMPIVLPKNKPREPWKASSNAQDVLSSLVDLRSWRTSLGQRGQTTLPTILLGTQTSQGRGRCVERPWMVALKKSNTRGRMPIVLPNKQTSRVMEGELKCTGCAFQSGGFDKLENFTRPERPNRTSHDSLGDSKHRRDRVGVLSDHGWSLKKSNTRGWMPIVLPNKQTSRAMEGELKCTGCAFQSGGFDKLENSTRQRGQTALPTILLGTQNIAGTGSGC